MNLSDGAFLIAAGEIRLAVALLDAKIGELRDTQQWVGSDSQQFFQEWDVDVRARLNSAALKLEGLVLIPFV